MLRTSLNSSRDTHVLEGTRFGRRMGKRPCEPLPAVDDRLAPNVLLHGMGWRYPGSTAFAPPGRTGNCHFHSKLITEIDSVFECGFPIRRHIHEPLFDNLWRPKRRIKVLKPCNSDPVHPLEIQLDAFLGDIPIHPVPPNAWARAARWIFKPLLQRVNAFWAYAISPTQRRQTMATRNNLHARIIVCVSPK